MSYLDFNYEKNSILICKGDARNRNKINLKTESAAYSEYHFDNKFNGIEIKDFLSEFEQDGLKGEFKFKQLLEANNLPYLYIGQGPFGIERSGILIEQTRSKRADYLVNIKDMGTILFDVKCRGQIGFTTSTEKYFTLFVSELVALNNLQSSILMPVWLAFTNRSEIHKDSNPIFYFVSISTIMKFWNGLRDCFNNKDDFHEIITLRIPNELLTKIDENIVFEVGYKNLDMTLISDFAKKNIGLNRIIKDKIKDLIRTKKSLKSKIPNELLAQHNHFCYSNEISHQLEKLIEVGVIEYEPKQFLKLVGE